MSDNVHVAVRMRSLLSRENKDCHWIAEGSTIYRKNVPSVQYQFDRVFTGIDTNEAVYGEFCAPLVKSIIEGFNGTIFAYGQTSSGKTFTLMGNDGKSLGIAHFTIHDIFSCIQDMPDKEFLLRVSYMEIYNEMVCDLLTDQSKNLKLKEDKYGHIKVDGLSEHIVQKPDHVLELLQIGKKKLKYSETLMNERSSRSHSIFQVIIESGICGDENAAVTVSQLNIVDLAGSEKTQQIGTKGARFKESININKSLLMLGNVIRQLSEKVTADQFINYRDSKITRILQNSLGGNARTAIICTITPASLEETHSTLRFATCAKRIKNKPRVNEVLTEQAMLKQCALEIKKLNKELEATKEENGQQIKSLKEQILFLRNKFVFQMDTESERRKSRRETWGGCLDAIKLRMSFSAQKFSAPDETSNFTRSPPTFRQSSVFEEPTSSSWNESERNLCSNCMSKPSSSVPSQTDAIVQTDIDLLPSVSNAVSSEPEKIKALCAFIETLENELAESREFSLLERQMMQAQNRLPGSYDDYNNKLERQKGEILSTRNEISQRYDSQFSIEGKNGFGNELCFAEKHSSPILRKSSVAWNENNEIILDSFIGNGEIQFPLSSTLKKVSKMESKNICYSRKIPFSNGSHQTSFLDEFVTWPEKNVIQTKSVINTNDLIQLEGGAKSLKEFSTYNSTSPTDIKYSDLPCVEKENDLDLCSKEVLSVYLKDLMQLKQFALEFIERIMTKESLNEIRMPCIKEDDYSVQDMLKIEMNALKEMLTKLEIYLKGMA